MKIIEQLNQSNQDNDSEDAERYKDIHWESHAVDPRSYKVEHDSRGEEVTSVHEMHKILTKVGGVLVIWRSYSIGEVVA